MSEEKDRRESSASEKSGSIDHRKRNKDTTAALSSIVFIQESMLEGTKHKQEITGSNTFERDLLAVTREHQIVIVQNETNSGRTAKIPQYLHEAGLTDDGKRIGCSQPHSVASMSAASHLANELGVRLGNEVGYSVRFKDCTSERTVIKYMTDGTLLHELLSDPSLDSYSVIMIYAQKATVETTILLGLLKQMSRRRSDLKLIICSTELNANKFSNFFSEAAILTLPQRPYSVDIYFTKEPVPDYIDACVNTVLQIHTTESSSGDILVFLAAQEEIEPCQEMLLDRVKRLGLEKEQLLICPLYSNQPWDMLKKIFEPTPPNTRKVVLTTHIAETSLTLDNIVYVIDSGFEKQRNTKVEGRLQAQNQRTSLDMLMNVPISKESANQRAGRVSHVAPGKCYRLYTAAAYENKVKDCTVPEIMRISLTDAILMLKALGINDLLNFDLQDPAPPEALALALEQLYALGALNHLGELTRTGRRMAELPVDPMMAKMLLASETYKCSEEIVTIAAMLLVKNCIFSRPKDKIEHADNARKNFSHPLGDHFSLMQLYNQWTELGCSKQWCSENYIQFHSMERARDIREKLVGLMQAAGIEMVSSLPDTTNVRKAIIAGYFYHVARRSNAGIYETVKHHQTVAMDPNSALVENQTPLVLYHELVFTTKETMQTVIKIDPRELLEVAPHYFKSEDFNQNNPA